MKFIALTLSESGNTVWYNAATISCFGACNSEDENYKSWVEFIGGDNAHYRQGPLEIYSLIHSGEPKNDHP